MESCAAGEEVPIPTFPLFKMVNAEGEDVAYASVEVQIYKFPPIEEKIQCLRFAPAEVSVSAKEG